MSPCRSRMPWADGVARPCPLRSTWSAREHRAAGLRPRSRRNPAAEGVRPPSYPPGGSMSAAGDLACLDAGSADVESRFVTAGAGHDVHRLDVRVPPAAGAAVGVRHRLAEAGAFPADFAHSGHCETPQISWGPAGWPGLPGSVRAVPRIATIVRNH